ncbi:MAG: glycosyltransferase family 2 protein [Bacteroidaceae bacterium]|nr:glycosyltransferase family 2 protein [Bacteroidaceae bacterium]
MTDLSVIIVSYNVKYYLEQCLRSVRASRGTLDVEVFVVDNDSPDDSVSYLRPRFPEVHIIANRENYGFSRANNQAIRQAKGRYVLLLNPDTILTERTLTDCVSYLDRHPEVGATGVSMYGSNGRFAWESRRGVPTPWTSFCKMMGLTALFPHSHRFGRYYMRYLDRTEANYIEVISGAFFMLRREAMERVGLLDETFFMYGEDIDLSYRLLQGGWKNAYVPSPILHYKGESTQKSSYRYVHIFYEAMLIFFDKHFSRRYRLLGLLIRLAVYLRAGLDMLKRLGQKFLSLFPRQMPQPEVALCFGTPESLVEMQAICERNGLIFITDTSRLSPLYVVYDISCYTYGDMLSRLIEGAGQGRKVALGTYCPETGTMILPNDIFHG